MTCTSCSGAIERMLQSTNDIIYAQVNLTSNTATVDCDPACSLTSMEIVSSIEDIGFGADILSENQIHPGTHTYIIHTYIHTYIRTDRQTDRHTYIQILLYAHARVYILALTHTHTNVHTACTPDTEALTLSSSSPSSSLSSFAPANKKVEISLPNCQVNVFDRIVMFLQSLDGILDVAPSSSSSSSSSMEMSRYLYILINVHSYIHKLIHTCTRTYTYTHTHTHTRVHLGSLY